MFRGVPGNRGVRVLVYGSGYPEILSKIVRISYILPGLNIRSKHHERHLPDLFLS